MQHRQPGGRLRQLLPPSPFGPRSLKTVRVQFNVDELRVDAAQGVGSETMTGERGSGLNPEKYWEEVSIEGLIVVWWQNVPNHRYRPN